MTDQDAAQLAARFDHHDPAQSDDPHSVYSVLRDSACPVARSETNGGFWLVTQHEDVMHVLQNAETFSSRSVTVPASLFGDFGYVVLPPITLDGDAHRDFRRIVLPAFSPKTILRWEDAARSSCREFIDEFIEKGECDAATEYARRVPVRIVSLMVGIPPDDEETFASWIHDITEMGGTDVEQGVKAGGEMWVYFSEKLAEHRKEPKDDLLTILIDSNYEGDTLDDAGLLGFLFLMITAGMDTTWSVIGDTLCHLARHPEHRRYLAEDPSRIPLAIEEFLRYFAPALLGRVATTDVDLHGSPVKEGESVLISYPSANRDERAFDRAGEVVLDRYPNRHIAFGAGVHRCIGAALARMELKAALEEWIARIPDFELSDPDVVRWGSGPVRGPRTLPLRFPPGQRDA
jgi:cytochrome P450